MKMSQYKSAAMFTLSIFLANIIYDKLCNIKEGVQMGLSAQPLSLKTVFLFCLTVLRQ